MLDLMSFQQTAITTVLSNMDLEQRRDKTYAVKQSMKQELITGRARFV